MTDTMFSSNVASGKRVNDSIIFQESSLSRSGIDTLAEMEFAFHIFDSESWDTYLDTTPVEIKTKTADSLNFVIDDSGTLLYSENGIRIIAKDLSMNENILGPSLHIFIENNTDKSITVQTRNTSINGFMIDPLFSPEIDSGKRIVSSMTFMKSNLEENEISDFDSFEFSFHIFETSGWNTIVDTNAIVYKPES